MEQLQKKNMDMLIQVVLYNSYKSSFNHALSYMHDLMIPLILMQIQFVQKLTETGHSHALCTNNQHASSSTSDVYMSTGFHYVHPRTTSYWERSTLIPLITLHTSLNIVDWPYKTTIFFSMCFVLARFSKNFSKFHPSQN